MNIKQVVLTSDTSEIAQEVLTIVPSAIGPRLGAETQKVIAAVKRGEWTRAGDGTIEAAGVSVRESEYSLVLHPRDEHSARALTDGAGVVSLDLDTTEELELEGLARDLVRLIQAARRDAGLHISDRIHLRLTLPDEIARATEQHRAWVMEQTLAVDLEVSAGPSVDIDLRRAS
jgi:isoleucyl-tRNA synthetase